MADPIVTPSPFPGTDPALFARFMAKVNITGGCWLWTGWSNGVGYGGIRIPKKIYAHRLSYLMFRGPIADSLCVLHKCDNPPCVRPDHLFLGTKSDNMRDCAAKGRTVGQATPEKMARGAHNGKFTHPEKTPRGENVGTARVTAEDVVAIRSLADRGVHQRVIARFFSISQPTVSQIVIRKTWRHVK